VWNILPADLRLETQFSAINRQLKLVETMTHCDSLLVVRLISPLSYLVTHLLITVACMSISEVINKVRALCKNRITFFTDPLEPQTPYNTAQISVCLVARCLSILPKLGMS